MKEFKIQGLIRTFGVRIATRLTDMDPIIDALNAQGIDRINDPVEVIIRIRDYRKEWVSEWYEKAIRRQSRQGIIIRHCKDATFIYENGTGVCASSAPRHGDKYDYKTGIAVAYAKVMDEPIPDYI